MIRTALLALGLCVAVPLVIDGALALFRRVR